MQTIKLVVAGECERIFEVDGDVSIVRNGDGDYAAECLKLEKEHKKMQQAGEVKEAYISPRAILQYRTTDSRLTLQGRSFIYDDDRAWIMNANGKTVATV